LRLPEREQRARVLEWPTTFLLLNSCALQLRHRQLQVAVCCRELPAEAPRQRKLPSAFNRRRIVLKTCEMKAGFVECANSQACLDGVCGVRKRRIRQSMMVEPIE